MWIALLSPVVIMAAALGMERVESRLTRVRPFLVPGRLAGNQAEGVEEAVREQPGRSDARSERAPSQRLVA